MPATVVAVWLAQIATLVCNQHRGTLTVAAPLLGVLQRGDEGLQWCSNHGLVVHQVSARGVLFASQGACVWCQPVMRL